MAEVPISRPSPPRPEDYVVVPGSQGPRRDFRISVGLRGGDQSEIVFGVLKIVLRGDRIVARVSVARQLKVSFSHMQRSATNSDVRAVRVIRTSQGVGFATAICLAAATSVILTK